MYPYGFFVEDTVSTRIFFGNAKRKLLKLLEAAGAARGLPGDHGFSPQKQYFQYQRYELRPPNTASGHEPRSASGGNIEPIKICALKAPGIVVSSPFKLSVVVRAKLTDSGKQPCAVL